VTLKNPDALEVRVYNDDHPICFERCVDADSATAIADRFFNMFTERPL